MTKQLQVGLVGYVYDQLTPDSGCAPVLCPFESRVLGVGPQVGYLFPAGNMQGYLNLKGYKEFDNFDRPDGYNCGLPSCCHRRRRKPPRRLSSPRRAESRSPRRQTCCPSLSGMSRIVLGANSSSIVRRRGVSPCSWEYCSSASIDGAVRLDAVRIPVLCR